jgi:hypothetical protein
VHSAGRHIILHEARRRSERLRILGVDPALDGVAVKVDLVLGDGQAVALGDAELLGDQVDVAAQLRDGMLDLEPGVNLDEVELAVLV